MAKSEARHPADQVYMRVSTVHGAFQERVARLVEYARRLGLEVQALGEVGREAGGSGGRPRVDVGFWTVLDALSRHDGNKERAARELGIGKGTLYRLLERGPTTSRLRGDGNGEKACPVCGGFVVPCDPEEDGGARKCLNCGWLDVDEVNAVNRKEIRLTQPHRGMW